MKYRNITAITPEEFCLSRAIQMFALLLLLLLLLLLITLFKVIQGHRYWYLSKAHIRLSISD